MNSNPAAAMANSVPKPRMARTRKAMSPEHSALWKAHREALKALKVPKAPKLGA